MLFQTKIDRILPIIYLLLQNLILTQKVITDDYISPRKSTELSRGANYGYRYRVKKA